jgi:hypothetical protein
VPLVFAADGHREKKRPHELKLNSNRTPADQPFGSTFTLISRGARGKYFNSAGQSQPSILNGSL